MLFSIDTRMFEPIIILHKLFPSPRFPIIFDRYHRQNEVHRAFLFLPNALHGELKFDHMLLLLVNDAQ